MKSSFAVLQHAVALVLLVSVGQHETSAFSINSAGVSRLPSTRLGSFLGDGNTEVPLTVARMVQPSVALVTPKGVRNMTARGSGFVVDYNNNENDGNDCTYIMTAAHVAAPGHGIDILMNGDTEALPATVVARNMTLDLALLRVDSKFDAAALTLATEIPEVGTLAFAHGHPASRLRGPVMTSGIVCGIADGLGMPNDMNFHGSNNNDIAPTIFVVTDAAMSGGMSGGPVVNAQGHVLGVNALIRPDLRALGNYAVSTEEVVRFLESAAADESSDDKDKDKKKTDFRVFLFNDRMNKKGRVSSVLKSVALLDDAKANKVMMEAHQTGRGIVGTYAEKTEADTMCTALRKEDLLVEFE